MADVEPELTEADRTRLVKKLARARPALRKTSGVSDTARAAARRPVNEAKVGLGERGPVWWTDGAPDYNRPLAVNAPYRAWYDSLPG